MNRLSALLACAVVLLAAGCRERPTGASVPEPPAIRIGDSFPEAHAKLMASGARDDILSGIYMFGDGRLKWYELNDRTCLKMVVGKLADTEYVRSLTLGEPCQGYGGKMKWLTQKHREVEAVALTD